MSAKIDIYISYSREDSERVQPIANALEQSGLTCYIDRPFTAPTASWLEERKKILGSVRCVLVIWSKHSLKSKWVIEESYFGKQEGLILPILLDDVRPPAGYELIQSLDLSTWKGDTDDKLFYSLLDAIKRVISHAYEQEEDSIASQLKSVKKKQQPDFKKETRIEPDKQDTEAKSEQEQESNVSRKQKKNADVAQWSNSIGELVWGKLLRISTLAALGLLCVYGSLSLARLGLSTMNLSQAAAKQNQPCLSHPGQGPEMVLITGGSFMMGSDKSANEQPVHEVTIQDFAIGRCQVTFDEYDRFARTTKRQLPEDEAWGRGQRPVINVSWEDAQAYAEWLSQQTRKTYRLPTEAEWEYMARAGTDTEYWWGEEINQNNQVWANCTGCGSAWDDKQTSPVGQFPANPFGVHDTAGNVWEWLEDCWHENYTGAPTDGSAWLETNGGDCGLRVAHGGSWGNMPEKQRSADRFRGESDGRFINMGFRLVQDRFSLEKVQARANK